MDVMSDPRLTNAHMSYDVWLYCVEMEWIVQSHMTGIVLTDARSGYDEGHTPKAYAVHKHAKACMTIVDNMSPFAQWINNYIVDDRNLQMEVANKPGWQPRVGKDEQGWLMQVWWRGELLGVHRFDRSCPPPPGWKR